MSDFHDDDPLLEGILDLPIEPMPPLPENEPERPQPTEAELDDLFQEIDSAILGHPFFSALREGLRGIHAYTERHYALVDLLVSSGVLPDTAHVAFDAILEKRIADGDLETFRSFVTATAKGLVRVSGTPVPSDDVATFFSAVLGPDPHPGEVVRSVVMHSGDKRLAHLYHYLRNEDQELGLLEKLIYYSGKERAKRRVAEVMAQSEKNAKESRARLAVLRKDQDKRRLAQQAQQAKPEPKTIEEKIAAAIREQNELWTKISLLKDAVATPGEKLVKDLGSLESIHRLLGEEIEKIKAAVNPLAPGERATESS